MLSRGYFSVKGSSILESVIALAIISTCLYIAVLVFATVFSPNTSTKFYSTQHQANEMFYLLQIQEDSINEINNISVETEIRDNGLKKVNVKYKDSLSAKIEKTFYLDAE